MAETTDGNSRFDMNQRTFLQMQVTQLRQLLEDAREDPILAPQLRQRLEDAEEELRGVEQAGGTLIPEGRAAPLRPSIPEGLLMRSTRITVDPYQMGGVPCIRGLRIPVATIVSMVAEGMSRDEILTVYPDLEAEDIRESLAFAAEAVRELSCNGGPD